MDRKYCPKCNEENLLPEDNICRYCDDEVYLITQKEPVAKLQCSDGLYSADGYYCTECEELCGIYEQGLSCGCGQHWETEVIYEEDYPDKWVKVRIEAKRI